MYSEKVMFYRLSYLKFEIFKNKQSTEFSKASIVWQTKPEE